MAGLGRRDAVVGDREVVPADQVVVLIRRRAVRNQAEQARASSTMLVERCLWAVAQSLAVCGQAAEGYADARNARQVVADRRRAATGQDGTSSLDGFQVQGLIDGQPVAATLTGGGLLCDPRCGPGPSCWSTCKRCSATNKAGPAMWPASRAQRLRSR